MSTIIVEREISARSLDIEPLEPEAIPETAEAACIARAIAQRMDPEWREFVAQEQFERMVTGLIGTQMPLAKPVGYLYELDWT